jgi:hypothetical protein
VAVQTELGVVREVGTEFQKEGTEVAVQAVEVVVIDQGGGLHNPGVTAARLRVAPLLGAENGCLLLRLAHENDPLGWVEMLQMIRHHVIFALPLMKLHHGDGVLLSESLDARYEVATARRHQRRRSHGLPQVLAEETDHPLLPLQSRHVNVEIHPVDTFDFQGHMLLQNQEER